VAGGAISHGTLGRPVAASLIGTPAPEAQSLRPGADDYGETSSSTRCRVSIM
jgi:hypothetical protein